MKCNLLLVFILFFSVQSFGQELRLRSSKTNLPVENASLLNVRSGVVDYTDKDGVAELSNFIEGDDILVSRVGYFDMTIRWVQFNKQVDKTFYIIEQVVPVPTAVITEFGRQELLSEVPRQVDVIGVDQLRFLNPQTSADVLQGSGKVLVQKSQQGGGSPIIRGFEANKILLVVDGVRMNNAIYRAGHLQNAITVDHNILEQVEVSFGPGSVVYGSDALGGVIHYRTRTPQLSESGEQEVKVNLNGRLGTANQEKLLHLDFSIAEGKVASLTSISRSDFGDLRMGSIRTHGDSLWGLVPEYVSSNGAEDVVLENPDPEIQKGTAYSQMDFLQKFVYQPIDSLQLIANFQFSNSSNIPRFDNLNDYRNGNLRWAEWSYGPQKRVLTSFAIKHSEKTGFYDEFNAVAAYQFIEESRYKRLLYSTSRNSQVEQVDVMSVNLDFLKKLRSQTRFNYGLEIVRNEVNSEAFDRDLETREITPAFTRYLAGGSTMNTFGAYVALKHRISQKWNFQAGARYSYASLNSKNVENDFFSLPFDEIQFSNGAFTGSLGLIWKPDSTFQLNTIASTGYRIPNVDDFGKVRENGGFVIVPNDQLKPEYVYTGEMNATKVMFDSRLRVSLGGFYSHIANAVVARPSQLNGQDSLLVEGEMARIETNVNANSAFIYGGFFEMKWQLTKEFSGSGSITYTYGEDQTDGVPLAHIPPLFGRFGVEYFHEKFRGEVFAFYNGKKELADYAPGGTDKPDEALEIGTPAWWTLNLSSSYYISKTLEAQFGIENILDRHYKVFASGISASGRNIYVGLRASF